MTFSIFILVLWGILGILTLLSKSPVTKPEYFLVWVVLMLGLMVNVLKEVMV